MHQKSGIGKERVYSSKPDEAAKSIEQGVKSDDNKCLPDNKKNISLQGIYLATRNIPASFLHVSLINGSKTIESRKKDLSLMCSNHVT